MTNIATIVFFNEFLTLQYQLDKAGLIKQFTCIACYLNHVQFFEIIITFFHPFIEVNKDLITNCISRLTTLNWFKEGILKHNPCLTSLEFQSFVLYFFFQDILSNSFVH